MQQNKTDKKDEFMKVASSTSEGERNQQQQQQQQQQRDHKMGSNDKLPHLEDKKSSTTPINHDQSAIETTQEEKQIAKNDTQLAHSASQSSPTRVLHDSANKCPRSSFDSSSSSTTSSSASSILLANDDEEEIDIDEEINEAVKSQGTAGLDLEALRNRLLEKTVIVHRDENGFGLRIRGEAPILVDFVRENSASWRAGVRPGDRISKVNGLPVSQLDHKEVVLMFKSSSRFIGLGLVTDDADNSNSDDKIVKQNSDQQLDSAASNWTNDAVHDDLNLILDENTRPNGKRPLSYSFRRNSSLSTVTAQADTNYTRSSQRRTKRPTMSVPATPPRPIADENASNQQQAPTVSLPETYKPASLQNIERRRQSVRTLSCNLQPNSQELISKNDSLDSNSDQMGQSTCVNCKSPLAKSLQNRLCSRCALVGIANNKLLRSPLEASASLRNPQRSSQATNNDNLNVEHAKVAVETDKKSATLQGKTLQHFYDLAQSASTSSLPLAKLSPMQVQQRPQVVNKRLEIIRELINTEKTHTDRLSWLDQLFYQPLKSGGLMSLEQLRAVFSCHRTLYKVHRTIYKILLSANYGFYMEPLIGSALLEIFEGPLKRRLERAACTFCSAQATNGDLLKKLTRLDSKTGEFLAQVRSQQTVGRLGIKDLLASCFQRLTKYPLLLENLLKATPENPPTNTIYLQPAQLIPGRNHPTRISSRIELAPATNNSQNEQIQHEQSEQISPTLFQPQDANCDPESASNKQARRMLAICLAEEREFIERALVQSRQILFKVNESIQVAESRTKLGEIWKRTDKYPGVPLIDITNQHLIHDGPLTLRLSKRSFEVYMLLLNDYIIILTREGQDKYRLKFFTPEGSKFSSVVVSQAANITGASGSTSVGGISNNANISHNQATVYSPVFVIDEHLTTRDAATDENAFYLLCKRKDDSRIYEFATRTSQERSKWRDKIQLAIDKQMSKCASDRRQSTSTGESSLTKSSSELSSGRQPDAESHDTPPIAETPEGNSNEKNKLASQLEATHKDKSKLAAAAPDGTQFVGTISFVEDDGIINPAQVCICKPLVEQAIKMSQKLQHQS